MWIIYEIHGYSRLFDENSIKTHFVHNNTENKNDHFRVYQAKTTLSKNILILCIHKEKVYKFKITNTTHT